MKKRLGLAYLFEKTHYNKKPIDPKLTFIIFQFMVLNLFFVMTIEMGGRGQQV